MKKVLIAGILIIVGFLVVLSYIPLGIEPLTEVYFENHTSLRANSFPNTEYNFSFSVRNLEYQDMGYRYNVTIEDVQGNFIKDIDSGVIYLSDNKSKTIFEKYTLDEGFERVKIKINILKDHLNITPEFKKKLWWPDPNYPNEIDIHYWTDEIVQIKITYTS